jgi:hypothetical protein
MNPERTVSDAQQPGSTGLVPAAPRACYVESASTMDVMFEQLDYLAAHASPACPLRCKDCARLEQVRKWLLLPFRPKARRRPAR